MQGKLITEITEESQMQEKTFMLPSNSKGIYMLRLTGTNTNLSKKIYLTR
jgi:hypothetical protein